MTLRKLARLPLSGVIIALVGAEAVGRPVYRPLATWIAGWTISKALDSVIAKLPPYAILALLAVPFGIAEPMKIVGVYWIGSGHVWPGLLTIVLAYGTSVLVVERIYRAGKPKLLTIGWFATLTGWAGKLKQEALGALHGTRAWKASQSLLGRGSSRTDI